MTKLEAKKLTLSTYRDLSEKNPGISRPYLILELIALMKKNLEPLEIRKTIENAYPRRA